jgi:uncharacterized protein (DUF362 family)
MLVGTAAVGVGYLGYRGLSNFPRRESAVFVAAHQRYDAALERTITDGLMAAGLTPQDVSGKRVLLKPNLVEPNRSIPHMTTHPAMVVAAAEVFRRWGGEVLVGEAPGHVRDTEMALFESGLEEALIQSRLDFADLNYEPVQKVENLGRTSPLRNWYLPQSVATADLIVSMPKLKTHHWMGMTASMKNLYGTLPGIKYGWPKNVLHHAGIPETVFDINATLPRTIAIVDAIVCMEGDGPLMGSPKPLGLVVIGENPTAVDATCARLMGLDPTRISYLQLAAQRLGPVAETLIHQRGEPWIDHRQAFEVLDYPHLQNLRAAESGIRAT